MREIIDPDVFHAVNRGGGVATRLLTQPIGAVFAAFGYRIGAPPAALTIAGMLLSAVTSVAALSVAADLPAMAVFDRIGLAVSLWIGWFFAAALDCADGQLARVTGRAAPAGAVLDLLCDVVTQAVFITALSAVAMEVIPGLPGPVFAFTGAMWMLTLVTSLLDRNGADVSLVPSGSMMADVVKLPRDTTAQICLAVIVIAAQPSGMIWLVGGLTVMNSLYALALIGRTAVQSTTGTASSTAEADQDRL